MLGRLVATLLLGLSFMPGVLLAADTYVPLQQRLTPEQLHDTGLDTLTSAQLDALNDVLRAEAAEDAAATPAIAPGAATPATPATPATAATSAAPATAATASTGTVAPLPGAADGEVEPDLVDYIDEAGRSIPRSVRGDVSGWQPGTVFVLDNGDRWQVLKGRIDLRETRHDPEVLLVPGILGRWFLQVDESMPKARVYRVR